MNPASLPPVTIDDDPVFEYDSLTGGWTANGEPLPAGQWVRLKVKNDGSGRFEKEIEILPPPSAPIGPMFLCPLHDVEQFESGPCPDCYDEADYEDAMGAQ